jgi:protein TonB
MDLSKGGLIKEPYLLRTGIFPANCRSPFAKPFLTGAMLDSPSLDSPSLDSPSLETVFADPSQRLFAPVEAQSFRARQRFKLLLVICLLVHLALLALFLERDQSDVEQLQPVQEIPVEVIVEPPPEQPPPPPPPEEKKLQQKTPPPPPPQEMEKPAFDAPRAPNEDKLKREAPDKETKSQAPTPTPQQQPAPQSAQEDTPNIAKEPTPKMQEPSAAQLPLEDKPEAEALDKAEQPRQAEKEKSKTQAARTKEPLSKEAKAAIARQLSAYAPIPEYKFGSAAKPAPVSGGTENTTYLSVLYGLIMKHLRNPNAERDRGGMVVVGFWLDDKGNLTHQVIHKSSGFPDIDAATLAAVRSGAPYPPPPRDQPHGFIFHREVSPRSR